MNNFQQKVLNYLNINENELDDYIFEPDYKYIESPYNFENMNLAKERILKAIKNEEKIMIYGDYDCDGISATAILVKMFLLLNKKVGYYIPSRYIDGYGLNINRAKQIKEKNYKLVITVDNGVSCHEALSFLKENNIDVILTDHHEITRELPENYCVLHPNIKKSISHEKQCGAYVAFMLSIAVLGKINDYLLSLASQATISDMMPLIGNNRKLLKLGLKIINNHKEYPLHLLNNKNQIIDEEVLGFTICPKINAFGRIKEDLSVNDIVRFFVIDDKNIQKNIAKEIELVNNKRKLILSEALNRLNLNKYQDKKIVIERLDNISEGVIGLVASRLLTELNKPSIVLTKIKDQDILKGSARSLKGFSLSDAFTSLNDLLLAYGGHEEAGGLSLEIKNYEQFLEKIDEIGKNVSIRIENEKYIDLVKEDFNYENYLFLKSLSPFGVEFNCPKFKYQINKNDVYFIGKEHSHIKGQINANTSFIGFSLSSQINSEVFDVIGSFAYDDFKKGKNIVFRIEKIL